MSFLERGNKRIRAPDSANQARQYHSAISKTRDPETMPLVSQLHLDLAKKGIEPAKI
jgi:hypothetical protein